MFITFEGPEGSGKTTQIRLFAEFLRARGYDVLTTREPGGTEISDQIRAVLVNLRNTAMHPRTEILLFQAARAQLVEQVIRPALSRGTLVLSDRYADSTLAYQGYGHGYPLEELRRLIDFATGGLIPDLTFLLDVNPAQGLERKQREGEWNRLDAYDLGFHQRVRAGYLEMARAEPHRWVVVDATQSIEVIQSDIRRCFEQRLAAR
ncbi:dTMP kinase [Anaerolinea thermophila]|uniref:Thymidylate kinase n=1 Tax=Anaerolinea thermophila (strain DSM 14523 / JCM 11388 / NBRC 100420 / UNI-1) TaxID=926569 RepID=E8MZ60_ANATU|nr:dTMP kinase [Anaerolinea thermophila]BAJ62203.1 thymidylate kinase [Anaerolinea thermophila UNI-1]